MNHDPTSQSPQIGASLRTQIPSGRHPAGRNVSIPSNRGKPSDSSWERQKRRRLRVSIPSNRGKPSDSSPTTAAELLKLCLNPLKSGQAFGLRQNTHLFLHDIPLSQSPQIGASLRTLLIPYCRVPCSNVSIPSNRGKPSDRCFRPEIISKRLVSIPSNRGKPSDYERRYKLQEEALSQSPQIGASLRTP